MELAIYLFIFVALMLALCIGIMIHATIQFDKAIRNTPKIADVDWSAAFKTTTKRDQP